jgi:hypothetical protein
VAVVALVGRCAVAVRADEVAATPTEVATEVPRYSPSARTNRPSVLAHAEVLDLAASVFGDDLAPRVARIVACESTNRPAARSAGWDRYYGAYEYLGLMQVSSGWTWLAVELTGSDDLTDPVVNLVTGRAILERQGWTAWPVCGRR